MEDYDNEDDDLQGLIDDDCSDSDNDDMVCLDKHLRFWLTSLCHQLLEAENQLIDHNDEEDVEDDEIREDDHLIALAMTEDEDSRLEIQLLTADGNLYTHHDILLPDFPLWGFQPPPYPPPWCILAPSGETYTSWAYSAYSACYGLKYCPLTSS